MPAEGPSPPSIQPLGDSALRIAAPNPALVRHAILAAPPAGLLDLVCGHHTLAAIFSPGIDLARAAAAIAPALARQDLAPCHPPRTIDIPTLYGGPSGPDLLPLASSLGLSPQALIDLHASASYTVRFMGFAPGFAYLEGLPAQLRVQRLDSPRPRVPAGTVAIAGPYSGIYPADSPGGWRLLGRTNLTLFDPLAASPTLLQPGDRVRFIPTRVPTP
ncbi:MAG: 5-oxoprolinase subunit PxpB [Phycisphaerales bacterium]|nr:5-oxoprolinase subunit PxpB [Phycisphaerales bacterium]